LLCVVPPMMSFDPDTVIPPLLQAAFAANSE
jgi:hypothetical protein